MHNRWYWTFKYILFGPFLRVWNRPFTKNIDRIPSEGPAILASNHLSVMDSFYLPLLCPRQITFLAKSEYFTTPGLVGRIQAWFFSSVGQYPIDRSSGQAAQDALNAGLKVVGRGDLMGMYPEGTRSPDGRLYRGKTGIARLAFESGQKVYPVAMINTRKANRLAPYSRGRFASESLWGSRLILWTTCILRTNTSASGHLPTTLWSLSITSVARSMSMTFMQRM